jgi:nucleoside-diphosphate-sugar epimerase
MKVLFIGGTGNISTAVSRLCIAKGIDLHLLNRGNRKVEIPGAKSIKADISRPDEVKSVLGEQFFDAVVNWIVFTPPEIERDIGLFRGKTRQYIFISSASAYQKPLSHPVITESTPLKNPYWQYSRDKAACEDRLTKAHREEDFPITIVRPSLTFDNIVPTALCGWNGYTLIDRMKKGKKIVVHGDGTSLWTITHSEDFAKGFVGLLGHQQAIGHAFHITSDEVLTWDQIYQATAAAAGVAANIVHIPTEFIMKLDPYQEGNLLGDKAWSAIFDNTKIKTFVPEFKATIPYSVGIKRTVEWMEADKSRMTIKESDNAKLDRIIEAYERP